MSLPRGEAYPPCEYCGHVWSAHMRAGSNMNGSPNCEICGDCQTFYTANKANEEKKMSSVNICDRCESIVKGSALAHVDFTSGEMHVSMDLCPACAGELDSVLQSNPDQDSVLRPRAYREPYERPAIEA